MSEEEIIRRTNRPATVASIRADLLALGLAPGMTVLVHSSLSSLGWVSGGEVAVIQGLEQALEPGGTLVMPTHSGDLSDPAEWRHPPVPDVWWETIRETMPAYDPALTPTQCMGAIPEAFRKQRGVLRSAHPQVSFAAWGAHAERVTANHELAYGLGEHSPLARLYELRAYVLLLGVGHGNNTSLHLAEYRATYPGKRFVTSGAPVMVDGCRQWVTFPDLAWDDADFEQIGRDFERDTGLVRRGYVARACALFFPQRELVDYAVTWMEHYR